MVNAGYDQVRVNRAKSNIYFDRAVTLVPLFCLTHRGGMGYYKIVLAYIKHPIVATMNSDRGLQYVKRKVE